MEIVQPEIAEIADHIEDVEDDGEEAGDEISKGEGTIDGEGIDKKDGLKDDNHAIDDSENGEILTQFSFVRIGRDATKSAEDIDKGDDGGDDMGDDIDISLPLGIVGRIDDGRKPDQDGATHSEDAGSTDEKGIFFDLVDFSFFDPGREHVFGGCGIERIPFLVEEGEGLYLPLETDASDFLFTWGEEHDGYRFPDEDPGADIDDFRDDLLGRRLGEIGGVVEGNLSDEKKDTGDKKEGDLECSLLGFSIVGIMAFLKIVAEGSGKLLRRAVLIVIDLEGEIDFVS